MKDCSNKERATEMQRTAGASARQPRVVPVHTQRMWPLASRYRTAKHRRDVDGSKPSCMRPVARYKRSCVCPVKFRSVLHRPVKRGRQRQRRYRVPRALHDMLNALASLCCSRFRVGTLRFPAYRLMAVHYETGPLPTLKCEIRPYREFPCQYCFPSCTINDTPYGRGGRSKRSEVVS